MSLKITDKELEEIQKGLDRWSTVSKHVAQKLLDEIYALKQALAMEIMHGDILARERDDFMAALDSERSSRE
jgi:hypothetical protein